MTETIELILNPEIIAVDGVVNGESYTFTLTGSTDDMSIWSATVPRSEDNIYYVTITATCGSGRCITSQLSTILYYGIHLITDRSQSDVDRVKALKDKGWANMTEDEKNEWSGGMKGSYNATDLNRVQSAIRYLQERLFEQGYQIELSDARTWMVNDNPTLTDLNNYLSDVRSVRNAFTLRQTTPSVPSTMVGLTYQKANDIEKILYDVDQLLSNMISIFAYSGELFGGETQ